MEINLFVPSPNWPLFSYGMYLLKDIAFVFDT